MAHKRILIFSLAYSPFMGGAELAVKEITDRTGNDFSFDMVTLRFDKKLPKIETIGNITVYRIGFSKTSPTFSDLRSFPLHLNKLFFQFTAAIKGSQLHRRNSYDAVWALMAHSSGVPVALFHLLHPKIPYMLTLQEGDEISHIKRMMLPFYPLFKRAFTQASVIQVISTYLGNWAYDMGFKGQVVVVHNGVDIKNFQFSISNFQKSELRKKLGIYENDKIIITTSRLVPKNAIDDIIKSLKFLPAHIKFLILGTGPDEHTLKELAKREGVESRVFFVGYVPYKNIPAYLQISDAFIRPSLSEGMGSSFVEAMVAGIPIIGTAVGGIPDFLKDNETGFVCRVKDPEHVAQKISYILDPQNRDHMEKVKKEALRIALRNHDWDKNSEIMKQLFNQITI
ncbi:MAG: glycosyltransferase [bacterium]|nr:glycosyltransferase [bacterium]